MRQRQQKSQQHHSRHIPNPTRRPSPAATTAADHHPSSSPVISRWLLMKKFLRIPLIYSGTTAHLNRHSKECPRKPKNLADKNQQQLNIVATINNVVSVNDVENFSDVTNIISGSSYTTANVFLPELWRIKVLLKNTIQSADESMKAMAIKMQQKFDKYWGDSNLVMAFAVVLDPRNKMRVIEVAFPDLYSEDTYLRHLHLVREKLYELFEEYVEEYKARDSTNPSERVAETVAEPSDESALEERTTDFNVIDWWRDNRSSYKILSRMATEIMAIPITSVASEAAFSSGGRVIDPSRASLGKKTVEALLCSQDWLKYHYGLTRSSKGTSVTNEMDADVEIDLS
ncbi:Putative AC transposase [Linum perenne]